MYYKEYLFNFKKKVRAKIEGIEGEDYVICQLCKEKVRRVYGIHLKSYHPNITIEEYKSRFPDSPIQSKKDKASLSKAMGDT